ncbi:MAG TPA: VWA domain-containing protein, partial [Pyrinomonadaceae bacterium]|nr:VWA domain-containing protein [Pyrinomonadaceae bacterium]
MKNHKSGFLTALFVLWFSIFAQAQVPTPTPTPKPEDEDVVVINTNLIQIDATVTDKNGKIVTDLTAEDFEIFENKEKQEITNFSFVSVEPRTSAEKLNAGKPDRNAPPAPPVSTNLKPEQVRRTIALVVDDLGLSFQSIAFVRQALKRFVDEQMQPGDLVAIVRTGGGIGALQQFTSDKRRLYAAIDRVMWNPRGRGGIGAFAPIEQTAAEANQSAMGGEENEENQERANAETEANQLRQDVFAVGTLGALRYIVGGLGELPGRKSVILFSDGFSLYVRGQNGSADANQRILEALRQLTDLANRAAVVVNTIDARGLQTLGLNAEDNTGGFSLEQLEQKLSDRKTELFDTQEGLIYLAAQTGGRSFINNNDIKGSVEKVLEDQKGYYLLGYDPGDETFDPKTRRYNKLLVKIKRPGLKVRYRSGFFGISDEAARTALTAGQKTPQQEIAAALISPFGANGVNLKLTSLFASDPKTGSFMRSFLHIDTKDLQFSDEPDGVKKADFEILVVTFGDNGTAAGSFSQSFTLRAKNANFQKLVEQGVVYNLSVPVKKPGAYQLRVALRDAGSARIGAANQFIEVPDLKKNHLTLSGLALDNLSLEEWQKASQGSLTETTASSKANMQTEMALRRFPRNSVLRYGLAVYNARLGADKKPSLTYQVRLFREGKQVFQGRETALSETVQTDPERFNVNGALALADKMDFGEYILQIVVR